MEKEGTTALSKAEKLQRAASYEDMNSKDRERKKVEFDAVMEDRVTRCHLMRMYPTPRQHAWLMRLFKDTRTTYNLAMGRVLERKLHTLHPSELKKEL